MLPVTPPRFVSVGVDARGAGPERRQRRSVVIALTASSRLHRLSCIADALSAKRRRVRGCRAIGLAAYSRSDDGPTELGPARPRPDDVRQWLYGSARAARRWHGAC